MVIIMAISETKHRSTNPIGNRRVRISLMFEPTTLQRLDNIRGQYSRSGVAESLILEALDLIDGHLEEQALEA